MTNQMTNQHLMTEIMFIKTKILFTHLRPPKKTEFCLEHKAFKSKLLLRGS